MLRCVRCGHRWTERPPADPEDPPVLAEDDEIPDFGLDRDSGEDFEELDATEGYEDEDEDEDEDDSAGSGGRKRRRGWFGRISRLVLLVLVLVVIILALLLGRDRFVAIWPPAQGFYGLAPIQKLYDWPPVERLRRLPWVDSFQSAEVSAGGLRLLAPQPVEEVVESRLVLKISGVVENTLSRITSVPPIMQIVLMGSADETIRVSDFVTPVTTLDPGASFRYDQSIENLPLDMAAIQVRFKPNDAQVKPDTGDENKENDNDRKPQSNSSSRESKPDAGKTVNTEKLKAVFE